MARPLITVRRVEDDLARHVVMLWDAYRVETGLDGARRLTDEVLHSALHRPGTAAYLAFLDGAPAGYVVLTDRALDPFSDTEALSIEQIYVHRDHRRAGVAKALLGAVAMHAQRCGSDQIASVAPSAAREASRFFARMGFASATVRRVTSTSALHRRLAADDPGTRFALDQLLARRRVARVRATQSRPAL